MNLFVLSIGSESFNAFLNGVTLLIKTRQRSLQLSSQHNIALRFSRIFGCCGVSYVPRLAKVVNVLAKLNKELKLLGSV